MSKKLFFLTNMFPSETAESYTDGFIQGGENITFIQKSIIEGLDEKHNYDIKIINKLLLSFGSRRLVKKTNWSRGMIEGVNFHYLNIPLFSSNLLHLFASKYIKDAFKNSCFVLAYGLTNCNLRLLTKIKKKNNKAKVGIIVPDIPEDTKNTKNFISIIKNKYTNHVTNKLIRKSLSFIDCYFLFSAHMASRISCKKYTTIEGIATDSFNGVSPKNIVKSGCFQIFYGGGIHKKYGAVLLAETIKRLDQRFVFVLCGMGDYVDELISLKLPNVICLGRVPREELLSLVCGSDVLVNPRTSDQSFSKYSFPSKNMEYLSSGVPFVGFKLGGIPNEYDGYINYPEEETAASFASKIQEVCLNKKIYKTRAVYAKEYVLKNKNKYSQAKKIIDSLL